MKAQDNPYHAIELMNITNPSGDFTTCLESQGKNIFLNAWFATQTDLAAFQHIELTPPQPWNLHQIEFPSIKYYLNEEIEARSVSIIGIKLHQSIEDDEHQIIYEEDIMNFNQILVASVQI